MSIHLSADAHAAGASFRPHWNVCVGAGRAAEGLRAGWLEQLAVVRHDCGFRYVRFHGLFHDDMFVYRRVNERDVWNFQYVDELFDRLLALDVKPFVELGFCPGDLARETGTVFWWKGNGSPPKDFTKWGELVRRLVEHLIARYGIEEVVTWYFEVWNEPNLHPFFRGTKSEYFKLYEVSAKTIKAIDPRLRVGGPSTSNFVPDARFDGEIEDPSKISPSLKSTADLDALDWQPVWLVQFLDFCARENLPVDFVSVHPYPTDWALDEHTPGEFHKTTRGIDATPKDLALVRRIVNGGPFPHAEIHLTEWSSSSSPRDFTHDYLQAATYVVKANIDSIGQVDSLSYWTFTDIFEEGGAGDTAFHGGFGMINYQGIVKPTFHAYRLLNSLGDEVLAHTGAGVVTRHRSTGKLAALVYHYPHEVTQTVPASFDTREVAERTFASGTPAEFTVELDGLPPGAPLVLETVDGDHGNALAAWRALGSPEPLSREHTAHLKRAATLTRIETLAADADGRIVVTRTLAPWTILSLRQL